MTGKYKGRKPIPLDQCQEVKLLAAAGMSKANIVKRLKIGEAIVYRVLKRQS